MRPVVFVLAAFVIPSWGIAQDQAKPEEIQLQAQFDAKFREPGHHQYGVHFTGTCSVPNDIQVRVTATWRSERISDSGELLERAEWKQIRHLNVRNHTFKGSFRVMGPGSYEITVEVPPGEQLTPPMTEALKKSLALKNRWSFRYGAWDHDLPESLALGFPEVQSLILETRNLLDDLQTATATEDRWLRHKGSLEDGIGRLHARADAALISVGIYPATLSYLRQVLFSLDRNALRFTFRDGKLLGRAESTLELAEDPSSKGIWWDGLKAALNETLKIAGREYALWTLKLLRESTEKSRPEVKASLAKVTAPELRAWTDRLLKVEPADDDALEKELRAASIWSGK